MYNKRVPAVVSLLSWGVGTVSPWPIKYIKYIFGIVSAIFVIVTTYFDILTLYLKICMLKFDGNSRGGFHERS